MRRTGLFLVGIALAGIAWTAPASADTCTTLALNAQACTYAGAYTADGCQCPFNGYEEGAYVIERSAGVFVLLDNGTTHGAGGTFPTSYHEDYHQIVLGTTSGAPNDGSTTAFVLVHVGTYEGRPNHGGSGTRLLVGEGVSDGDNVVLWMDGSDVVAACEGTVGCTPPLG